VTEIRPSTAAFGTVTLRVVPPTPIVNGAVTVPLNFTDVVPWNVFPLRVSGVPAAASFGFGSPMIVGRTFSVVGLVVVPFVFAADTAAVGAVSGIVSWMLVSVMSVGMTMFVPTLTVGFRPVARKFDPFTVTVSPTW